MSPFLKVQSCCCVNGWLVMPNTKCPVFNLTLTLTSDFFVFHWNISGHPRPHQLRRERFLHLSLAAFSGFKVPTVVWEKCQKYPKDVQLSLPEPAWTCSSYILVKPRRERFELDSFMEQEKEPNSRTCGMPASLMRRVLVQWWSGAADGSSWIRARSSCQHQHPTRGPVPVGFLFY